MARNSSLVEPSRMARAVPIGALRFTPLMPQSVGAAVQWRQTCRVGLPASRRCQRCRRLKLGGHELSGGELQDFTQVTSVGLRPRQAGNQRARSFKPIAPSSWHKLRAAGFTATLGHLRVLNTRSGELAFLQLGAVSFPFAFAAKGERHGPGNNLEHERNDIHRVPPAGWHWPGRMRHPLHLRPATATGRALVRAPAFEFGLQRFGAGDTEPDGRCKHARPVGANRRGLARAVPRCIKQPDTPSG